MRAKLIAILIFLSGLAFSKSDSILLIQPTGPYAVGTMVYEWEDNDRNFNFSSYNSDPRTLICQVWYPSLKDNSAQRVPYSLSEEYNLVKTNSFLRTEFHPNLNNVPIIIFVPGRGLERFAYTSIIEELASYGFFVVSVDLPEIGYARYKDGFEVKPSQKFAPPEGMMAGPYEKVDAFFDEATRLGNEDLQFITRKLEELSESGRFKNKINPNKIGVFGHSLGGRIAGYFSSQNSSVKAYASMEGIPPRKVRFEGLIRVPSLMMCSKETWYYAKENYQSFLDNCKEETYMLQLVDFGHNSFTEGPYLFSKSFKYAIDPVRALELGRELLLNFFNMHLNDEKIDFEILLHSDVHYKFEKYPK